MSTAGQSRRNTLSIEERYDEVRQLIQVGKEKGYLLYDEVNEMLPIGQGLIGRVAASGRVRRVDEAGLRASVEDEGVVVAACRDQLRRARANAFGDARRPAELERCALQAGHAGRDEPGVDRQEAATVAFITALADNFVDDGSGRTPGRTP